MKRSERGEGPVGERELFPKGAEFDKSSGKSSKREEREKPVNRGLGDSKVSQPPGANVISLFKGGMGGVGWQQMLWFFYTCPFWFPAGTPISGPVQDGGEILTQFVSYIHGKHRNCGIEEKEGNGPNHVHIACSGITYKPFWQPLWPLQRTNSLGGQI